MIYNAETLDAISVADRSYMRAFSQAMRAFDAQPGLRAAMDAYNAIMGPANARWRAGYRSAVALSQGAEF